jgi:PatG Domain
MQEQPKTPGTHPEDSKPRPVTASANPGAETPLFAPAQGQPDPGSMPFPEVVPQAAASAYVYVIGRIGPRFRSLSAEKEFAQATGRAETAGLTDRQTLHAVLSQRHNRYLARELCWVLTVEGLDTYILHPRDPADLDILVEALRPTPRPTDIDVVVGIRGPIAPPELCNGLTVPIVVFDQIYSFDVDSLIQSIPRPESIAAEDFQAVAEELFYRIMQMADNAGATDEHRAFNYLPLRYPAIYAKTAEEFARDFSLSGVEARRSAVGDTRNIVDVIFSYTNRNTDFTEKFFVRCDVTEEYPFLVTKLSPYYDR